jgi:uncharacterized membrane protein
MTSTAEETTSGAQQQGGFVSGAVSALGGAARDYAKARGQVAARRVGDRLSGVTGSLNDTAEGGGFKAAAAGSAVSRLVQGQSPVKAALGGVGAGIKEKLSGLFGRSKSGGASGNKRFMSIIEDVTVGVPVDVAYDQWTQFQEFASFMKGVDSVEQTDEVNSNWRVKVFWSRRNWKGTVTEQIPDRKIAWTTEGAKGTTKGAITFHPLADDLTQVLLVMEYYPQGMFEKTGNIWRAQGRRARLDLKNFRRFIMQRGEATGSWRGEIRDGEVVRGPDEAEGREGREAASPAELESSEQQAGDGRARQGQPARAEAEGEGEGEEEYEGEEEEGEEEEGAEYEGEEYEGAEYEGEEEEGEEEEQEEPEPEPAGRR